ncbi:MAG TPA: endonuclease [Microscillaceae bacterium]|nr:endonuclease [Microscillaceae bacterium]
MKKHTLLIILVVVNTTLVAAQAKYQKRCIAFYNVENLFDTVDDPEKRDEEFLPSGRKQWDADRYAKKLDKLSLVLSKLGEEPPAVIGLCEVENKQVVEDLVKTKHLKKYNYKIVHYPSPDRRGIDVALIYRPEYFKVTSSKSYRLTDKNQPDFITRDQLLVTGEFDGDEMHLIVNHWPSRYGGKERSAPRRMLAAKLSRRVADSLLNANRNAKLIVMGDLNDNPNDPSLTQGLKAFAKRPKGKNLYNAMAPLYKKGIGSLRYRDEWFLFDQIIVSKALVKGSKSQYRYLSKSAKVYAPEMLKQKEGRYKGYPDRTYAGRRYLGGFSDHFPVFIYIGKRK